MKSLTFSGSFLKEKVESEFERHPETNELLDPSGSATLLLYRMSRVQAATQNQVPQDAPGKDQSRDHQSSGS
jgi:hypothetical protein